MSIFGFLTDSDLTPLRDRIADLEFGAKLLQSNNNKLLDDINLLRERIASLEKYCYNVGGDSALLKKQVAQLLPLLLESQVGPDQSSSPPA